MDEPQGLGLSLDDIIKQQQGRKKPSHGFNQDHRRRSGGPDRHHQRHGGRGHGGRGGHHQGKQNDYRRRQKCYREDDTGLVVVEYRGVNIISITPNGDITLNTEGYYNEGNLNSLNDSLNPIGFRISAIGGDISKGEWSISDGKTLTRYADGVVIPGKGAINRAQLVLDAFNNPSRMLAARATERSNMRAGFVPAPPSFNFKPRGGGGGGGFRGGRGGRGGGRGGRGGSQNRYAPY